jgi:glycosyltransferase involved in cell wall biosynthesis
MLKQPGDPRRDRLATLYVCYFGIGEPLVQTQVLPYLRDLAEAGYAVYLLTFETIPLSSEGKESLRTELLSDGIVWSSLRYHKRPSLPATLYDVAVGATYVASLTLMKGVHVLHARSHVPLVISLLARPAARARIVFDLRGLMAEEYVEGGVWREGSAVVRLVKWCERIGFRLADQTVVLTERMRDTLLSERLVPAERVEVIPCCTDLSLYPRACEWVDPPTRSGFPLHLVYAGSIVGLYQLDEMARFFIALHQKIPGSFFRILTTGAAQTAVDRLRDIGVPASTFSVGSVPARDVPALLSESHAGISFRKSTPSQMAASPTKIAEYLAAGLPVVSNAGIGDMDRVLTEDRVGVVVESYSQGGFEVALTRLDELLQEPGLRARCQESARRRFGLREVGSVRYRRLYERLETLVRPTVTPSTSPSSPGKTGARRSS